MTPTRGRARRTRIAHAHSVGLAQESARSAEVPRTSTNAAFVALILVSAGVALLAGDYAVLPASPLRYLLYWVALGLAFWGVILYATSGRPGAGRQLVALAALGAVTWLPYFLRSPERLLFVDERFHFDIVTRLAEAGHTPLPVTLFPLPGTFPGLENVTLALMAVTGLPALAAARVVTLAIHITIPMLAYLVARGVGHSRGAGFLAALVYVANTSFVFFHAVFSYESLGIVLFLATWATIALYRGSPRPGERRRRIAGVVLVAVPLLAGIAVTHHVSSYVLAATLSLAWLAARLVRAQEARAFGIAALFATAFAVAWFFVSRDRVEPYLVGTLSARVDAIVQTLLIERSQPRALFANSELPVLERLIAYAYPPIVLALGASGLFLAWRRRARWSASLRGRAELAPLGVLWLALALAGPLAWIATAPAVITRAGELAYRSWPFLFLGVGVFAAVALVELRVRLLRTRARPIAQAAVFGTVGIIMLGGFSIGDNQAGRFPSDAPVTSAGSGNVTAEVISASRWLQATAGTGRLIITDNSTATVFGTEGRQRILKWQTWFPFITRSADDVLPFLVQNEVDFVIVDRQIAALPPRYGGYFGPPDIPSDLDPGQPFPAGLLDRFDSIPGLDRIYDSGRIVIYERRDRRR